MAERLSLGFLSAVLLRGDGTVRLTRRARRRMGRDFPMLRIGGAGRMLIDMFRVGDVFRHLGQS